jgi:hypothetical protein
VNESVFPALELSDQQEKGSREIHHGLEANLVRKISIERDGMLHPALDLKVQASR